MKNYHLKIFAILLLALCIFTGGVFASDPSITNTTITNTNIYSSSGTAYQISPTDGTPAEMSIANRFVYGTFSASPNPCLINYTVKFIKTNQQGAIVYLNGTKVETSPIIAYGDGEIGTNTSHAYNSLGVKSATMTFSNPSGSYEYSQNISVTNEIEINDLSSLQNTVQLGTIYNATVNAYSPFGKTLTYQWYKSSDGQWYSPISGQTTENLSYTTTEKGAFQFKVVISDGTVTLDSIEAGFSPLTLRVIVGEDWREILSSTDGLTTSAVGIAMLVALVLAGIVILAIVRNGNIEPSTLIKTLVIIGAVFIVGFIIIILNGTISQESQEIMDIIHFFNP